MQSSDTVRAATPQGEIVLRHRGDVVELIVNGVFAMDSTEVTSEYALADAAGAEPASVLVGGLGLGFTAARLLDRGSGEIVVVEFAQPLIAWARAGVTEQLGRVASDPRVTLVHADVVPWLPGCGRTFDAILLDVDNGPSFLIHEQNARVYAADWLAGASAHLRPNGRLVIWCESPSTALHQTLAAIGSTTATLIPVTREGRAFTYALYTLQAPATP